MEYRKLPELTIQEMMLDFQIKKTQSRYDFLGKTAQDAMFDCFYDDDEEEYNQTIDTILEERFHLRQILHEKKELLNQVRREQLYELYPSCEPIVEQLEKQKTKTYQITR